LIKKLKLKIKFNTVHTDHSSGRLKYQQIMANNQETCAKSSRLTKQKKCTAYLQFLLS